MSKKIYRTFYKRPGSPPSRGRRPINMMIIFTAVVLITIAEPVYGAGETAATSSQQLDVLPMMPLAPVDKEQSAAVPQKNVPPQDEALPMMPLAKQGTPGDQPKQPVQATSPEVAAPLATMPLMQTVLQNQSDTTVRQAPVMSVGTSATPTPADVPRSNAGIPATHFINDHLTTNAIDPDEKKDIYLNFDNTDISNFIDYIGEMKKLNIVADTSISGSKISLTIREPLSIDGAWRVFLTVLDTAGFGIVKVGDVHKIITKDKKVNQPLPAYINVPVDTLPASDLTIRYVLFLTNIQVSDVEQIVNGMLSESGASVTQKDLKAFIITDKSNNIRAAVKLLRELDHAGLPESVAVLKLKRVNATDVRDLLKGLIRRPDTNVLVRLLGKQSEGGAEYFSPTTRVIADDRNNSLILLGNNKSIDKIIDFVTKNIDTEFKEVSSPLHVYELQNIDAKHVADMLTEVLTPPSTTAGQAASKYGAIRGGVKYFKPMTFTVDTNGNRLIVSCTDDQDWRLLKKMLDDIDKPQPQIALESMIVLINATDLKSLGGAIRNKNHNQIGKNIDFQSAPTNGGPNLQMSTDGTTPISLLGNLLGQVAAQAGQTVLTFGAAASIWSILTILKTYTNTTVLSQPFITVANKTPAVINVGQILRIVDQTQASTSATTGDTFSYKDCDASTNLKVTPQINLDGVIGLDIDLNIVSFDVQGNPNARTARQVKSIVSVADGQVLALGGFVQTSILEDESNTPVLSKIPILGWFFKNKSRTINKTYIFVFMAPTIIKPRQQPGMQMYTKMKLHQATTDVEDAVDTRRSRDPIQNWFFNPDGENYSHKVIDFANARFQPTTVDIKNDPYYRTAVRHDLAKEDERREDSPGTIAMAMDKERLEPLAQKVASSDSNRRTPLLGLKQASIGANGSVSPDHPAVPAVALREGQKGAMRSVLPVMPATPEQKLAEQRQELKGLLSSEPISVIQSSVDAQPEQKTMTTQQPFAPMENPQGASLSSAKVRMEGGEGNGRQEAANKPAPASIDKGRNALKEFLTAPRDTQPQPAEQKPGDLVIDPDKRNSLKDFLARAAA